MKPWVYPLRLIALVVVLGGDELSAQSMSVPSDLHVPLLMRVLTFDRALQARGDAFVVVVLFQGRNRASVEAKDGAMDAIQRDKGLRITTLPVRVETVDIDATPDLVATLTRFGAEAVYFTPLRAVSIEGLVKQVRAAHAHTLTGVDAYLANGVAVAVRSRAERPRVAVNLTASKLEGSDYAAPLLAIADVEH
jgi:hypothetical protein